MGILDSFKSFALGRALEELHRDPERSLLRAIDLADECAKGKFAPQRRAVREAIEDPTHPCHPLVRRILQEVDPQMLKTVAENLFVNGTLVGWEKQEEYRDAYHCHVPWAISVDPAGPGEEHLTREEADQIITQGEAMGTFVYSNSGEENAEYVDDLIWLCEKHPDSLFLAFTKGAIVSESFCQTVLRVKNLVPIVYLSTREPKAAQKAMDLLHENRILFGAYGMYNRNNHTTIVSEACWDDIIRRGASFVWYFHYIPVGKDADAALLPTAEERRDIRERIRTLRKTKPLFAMDSQNDADYLGGCPAGGRRYLHINARGDVEPCAFIPYSNANIRQVTLLEALQSPIFRAFSDNIPFDENLLRPCPLLENPELIRFLVAKTGAKPTHLEAPEPIDQVCARCQEFASAWRPVSDQLWQQRREETSAKGRMRDAAAERALAQMETSHAGEPVERKSGL